MTRPRLLFSVDCEMSARAEALLQAGGLKLHGLFQRFGQYFVHLAGGRLLYFLRLPRRIRKMTPGAVIRQETSSDGYDDPVQARFRGSVLI